MVTLFWDALLSIGHAHSFPRPRPDYYPVDSNFTASRILNGFDSVFGRESSTISARLRLVVIYGTRVSNPRTGRKTAPPKD